MNCRSANERIHAALDERRNPLDDAQLAQHVAKCTECRGLIVAMQLVDSALRQPVASPAPPSAGALKPLPEQWSQPAASRRPYWVAAIWLAAAAAVLLVVSSALFPPEQPDVPRPVEQFVAHDNSLPADDRSAPPPAGDLADLALQAESSYRQLAADTQANVTAAWQLVPAQAFSTGSENRATTQPASMWREFGAGLNPLAAATADSLGVLWQALPEVPSEPKEHAL